MTEVQIENESQYRRALVEIQKLEAAKEGTPEHDRRLALLAAAELYEQSNRNRRTYRGRPGPE